MKAMTSIFCVLAVVIGLSIPAYAKLVDMRDGTVYDTDTQLSWLKDAGAGGEKTWDEAVAWAASLNEKGGFAAGGFPLLTPHAATTIVAPLARWGICTMPNWEMPLMATSITTTRLSKRARLQTWRQAHTRNTGWAPRQRVIARVARGPIISTFPPRALRTKPTATSPGQCVPGREV